MHTYMYIYSMVFELDPGFCSPVITYIQCANTEQKDLIKLAMSSAVYQVVGLLVSALMSKLSLECVQ